MVKRSFVWDCGSCGWWGLTFLGVSIEAATITQEAILSGPSSNSVKARYTLDKSIEEFKLINFS